jgi:hypothetical protein
VCATEVKITPVGRDTTKKKEKKNLLKPVKVLGMLRQTR